MTLTQEVPGGIDGQVVFPLTALASSHKLHTVMHESHNSYKYISSSWLILFISWHKTVLIEPQYDQGGMDGRLNYLSGSSSRQF